MIDTGEQLVSSYLRYIKGCDFVEMNVIVPKQLLDRKCDGEIDVIGLNTDSGQVYLCEVAAHENGLNYGHGKSKPCEQVLLEKFQCVSAYAKDRLKQWEQRFMFWTPTISEGKLNRVKTVLKVYNVEIISGDIFFEYIDALRRHASKESGKLLCPLMRLMQIESWCQK